MAKILKILTRPDPRLTQKSQPISDFKKADALIPDLIETMYRKDGIGIAAPQVGENIRLIIINSADGPLALINPEIYWLSKRTNLGEEGCLSVPGIFGWVRRHHKIKVKAQAVDGTKISFAAENLLARVIQHEIDHLDGILFTDKAEKMSSDGKAL